MFRTPSPSMSFDSFESVKSKKSKMHFNYRSRNGDLWSPAKGWLTHYRCAACHVVMSRKEATKFPQRIHACDHITCANCIINSYLVEHNPICPVKDCGKCVNHKQKELVQPLTSFEDKEIIVPLYEDYPYKPITKVHYCGDKDCEYDCGVLVCGCIDQCRGRCGLNRRRFIRHR